MIKEEVMKTLTDIQLQVVKSHSTDDEYTFERNLNALPKKDYLAVIKHLGIKLYEEMKHRDSLEILFKYLPQEVQFSDKDKRIHYFQLIISRNNFGFSVSYYHFFVEDEDEENCGMTDVWLNPFEEYRASNHLIKKDIQPNQEDLLIAVRSIYEFLIENEIVK